MIPRTYYPGVPRANREYRTGGNAAFQPGGYGDIFIVGDPATCMKDPNDNSWVRINRGLSTNWDSIRAPLVGAPIAAKPEQIMAVECTLWAFQMPAGGLNNGPVQPDGSPMGNTSDAIAPAMGVYSKTLDDAELAKGNEDGYSPAYIVWDRVRVPEYYDTLYTQGTYGWGEGHKVHQGGFASGEDYYASDPPPVNDNEERAFEILCQADCEVLAGFGGNPGASHGLLKAIEFRVYVGAFGGGWALGEEG